MVKLAEEICPSTTLEKVKNGALMVDVRRENEVKQITYDVENYVNIPMHELEDRIDELPKDREIVVVCRSGMRSLKSTYFLMNNGFENVFNMDGGILKWVNKNLPSKGDAQGLIASANCDCSQPDCC
ncbi:MAG: rhodanese-like domain-containing protein [Calditrichaeota bacterium]|nr:MAG: rhodanese-like domain-containing protein [Calditrichota bacterium]